MGREVRLGMSDLFAADSASIYQTKRRANDRYGRISDILSSGLGCFHSLEALGEFLARVDSWKARIHPFAIPSLYAGIIRLAAKNGDTDLFDEMARQILKQYHEIDTNASPWNAVIAQLCAESRTERALVSMLYKSKLISPSNSRDDLQTSGSQFFNVLSDCIFYQQSLYN